jgi:ribosome-binding protein aMBF1 (putative translation factor)
MAKIDATDYAEAPKKRVSSESLQELIRKRMELKLNQDKADQLCNFPRHTIKGIESRRILPTPAQQSVLQKTLGIQLKMASGSS